MWILTEDNTMINTDNVTYMHIDETENKVFIRAYLSSSQSGLLGNKIFTDNKCFCIFSNTEDNKNTVKRIFNEIFDNMYSDKKTFNIPKRLLGKN